MDGAVITSSQSGAQLACLPPCRIGFPRSFSTGFTLVEVMIVIVIMGVFASLAAVSIDAVLGRDAEREAERLRKVLELAADRASIRGTAMTLDLLPHAYRFSIKDKNTFEWRLMFSPPEFAERNWAADLRPVSLEIAGETQAPPWRLNFGSESPEYRLHLATSDKRYLLEGKFNGTVILTRLDSIQEPQP